MFCVLKKISWKRRMHCAWDNLLTSISTVRAEKSTFFHQINTFSKEVTKELISRKLSLIVFCKTFVKTITSIWRVYFTSYAKISWKWRMCWFWIEPSYLFHSFCKNCVKNCVECHSVEICEFLSHSFFFAKYGFRNGQI